MSTYTTNYNLEKPDSTDDFKDFRSNYNSNMDIIDANLGGGGGSDVSWNQLQVTGDKIATIRISGIDTSVYSPNSQTFSMAISRANINSDEKYSTIFGKIKKWFNDLKTVAFSGSYNDLSDQPTIPTATSDLNNDSDFVSDASYVHTDNNFTNADVTKLSGIQSGAEVNVQSDWNEADNTADDYIKNKPTIPTNTSDLNNDSGFLDSSDITITQVVSTGTKIATIDVDGTSTDLYAPNGGGGGSVNDVTVNGTSVVNAQGVAEVITSDRVAKSGDAMSGNLNVAVSGGESAVVLGNTTTGNTGAVYIYANGTRYNKIVSSATGGERTNTLPNKDGTFAMTDDIPTNTNQLTNGAGFISDTLPIIRNTSDIPEGADNLSNTATAHRITAYQNGLSIPYQMDNTNDGGILRVRGTSESNCIFEMGTWDDSGDGETIQFNYYPTTSQVTPTYSVSVPKKSGTIALTSDIPDVSGKVNKSGDSMSGVLSSSYKSQTWLNSWYSSAISLDDSTGSFGGWICGPTKNGRIAIQSFQGNDDKLYIGYATRGRTTNSNERQVCWNGATGKWECDITGTAEQANKDGSGNTITSTYLKKGGDTITGNLVIGNGGGYLNAGASNGGCNSILIGDDAWLGDVNKGGTVGVKSANSTGAGFHFYGSSGEDCGALYSNGTLSFTGDLTAQGVITAYNFINLYSDTWSKQVTLTLPSLTDNRTISFPNKGGTIAMTSDISSRRYKENIIPLSEDEAKKILDIEIVNYDYKENVVDEDERYDQKGAIAEDVVNLIPNAVTYADINGEHLPDGINYTKFIPYLIKMVQMQQKEIEELKAMIKGE